MSDDEKHGSIDDLIESAMKRLERRPPEGIAAADRKERERFDLGRRDYDAALARRLDQLRQATGKDVPVIPPSFQSAAPGPAPQAALQGRGFQTGTLIVTALFSAVAGAVAMWLTIGANPQLAKPKMEIASAQPIVTPVAKDPVQTAPPAATPGTPPADDDQVRALIEGWRSAWADRDIEAYLACYSAEFTPANGQSHDAWVAARRKKLSTRGDIAVSANELKVERLDAQRMTAHFLQDYASGRYRETAQAKTLLLVRDETGWKIAGEWQGEAPASALAKR